MAGDPRPCPFCKTDLRRLEMDEVLEREKFERWITSEPYVRSRDRNPYIGRFPDKEYATAWPDQYKDINVQMAWEAWQEALRQNSGGIASSPDLTSAASKS